MPRRQGHVTRPPGTPDPRKRPAPDLGQIRTAAYHAALRLLNKASRPPLSPAAFLEDVLAFSPAPYQIEALDALFARPGSRVAVRAPHGVGKTALAATAALYALATFPEDVKIVITTGAWRQVTKFLFPEIRKWARGGNWDKVGLNLTLGKEILELSIRVPKQGKELFAVVSDDAALIEGAHAAHILYILDEAKAIPDPVWDAVEGGLSAGNAYALAVSTPGAASGRFYDIHSRDPKYRDWQAIHITLDQALAAGRVNPDWVAARAAQWGTDSAVFQNRVLGNFATDPASNLIPLSWIEAAIERHHACNGRGAGLISYGVDVARSGRDKSAIARLVGNVLERLDLFSESDLMATTGRVIAAMGGDDQVPVAIDVIGIGAGVYDRLHEQRYNALAVNVANRSIRALADGELGFANLRSELWWSLRERLDPRHNDALALPDDPVLISDLSAPRFAYTSAGKIAVESKDDMRKRLGRSTDAADALALALYAVQAPGAIKIKIIAGIG